MDLTPEQQQQLQAIKDKMNCPNDFRCEKSGFTVCGKVRRVGELLECFEVDRNLCPFALPFGYGHYCRCPLNNYVRGLTPSSSLRK